MGSGDSPGLQNRREAGLPRLRWVRLPLASANLIQLVTAGRCLQGRGKRSVSSGRLGTERPRSRPRREPARRRRKPWRSRPWSEPARSYRKRRARRLGPAGPCRRRPGTQPARSRRKRWPRPWSEPAGSGGEPPPVIVIPRLADSQGRALRGVGSTPTRFRQLSAAVFRIPNSMMPTASVTEEHNGP